MQNQTQRVLAYETSRLLTEQEMASIVGAGTVVTTGSGKDTVKTCDDDNGNTVTCPKPKGA